MAAHPMPGAECELDHQSLELKYMDDPCTNLSGDALVTIDVEGSKAELL